MSESERYLLDTSALIELADDEPVAAALRRLVEAGEVDVVLTHLQADELGDESAASLRWLLEDYADEVATWGFALDYSRLGQAGVVDAPGEERLGRLRGKGWGDREGDENIDHSADALMMETAREEGAVFVTADDRAYDRMNRSAVRVRWRRYVNWRRDILDGD